MKRLCLLLLTTSLLAPLAAAEPWLTYDRSGGITGWRLKVSVSAAGEVAVVGTRQDEGARRDLSSAELEELRGRVEKALAHPPRAPRPDMKHLVDGMQRLVTVQDDEGGRLLNLSDGFALAPGDLELVRALEALVRRDGAGPAETPGTPAESSRPPPRPLDTVRVAGASGPRSTVVMLELPIGRAHEPAGRAGTIELLIALVLEARSELLLDAGAAQSDPNTGDWTLAVTPARTRLSVRFDAPHPSALRAATAQLRRLLLHPRTTIEQLSGAELDHQRRRLADAVHDRARDPAARRHPAARLSAWGESGLPPTARSVTAIEREHLLELADRVEEGHARLLAIGSLGGRALSLCSRGFERRARGPLPSPAIVESERELRAPANEFLLAAPVTEQASGPAAALALELARRRLVSNWSERLEAGDISLAVPGDTLLLVAPSGAVRPDVTEKRMRAALERLSRGLTPAVAQRAAQRRPLGALKGRDEGLLLRFAADLLELGAEHPGREEFDVVDALVKIERVEAEDVRAAAAELAETLRTTPSGPPREPDLAWLERAAGALLGQVDPSELELRGESAGGPLRLRYELDTRLGIERIDAEGSTRLEAGRLSAAPSPAASREQALLLEWLSQPEPLVAGATQGRFPVVEGPAVEIEIDGRRLRCPSLDVLVPARGSFRLFVDPRNGDVRAVDRRDPFGRTWRLEMSDIREFEEGRRTAALRVLLSPEGERETLLEGAELSLQPR